MQALFSSVFEIIQNLGQKIFEDQGPFQGTLTLFWHNFRAILAMVSLGLALGVYPLMGMLLNGALLGVVLAFSILNGQPLVFLAGVLPHAIFELPALVIGAGAGFYLGWGPFGKDWGGYKPALRIILDVLLLSMILLVAAAVIEVNITPLILNLVL